VTDLDLLVRYEDEALAGLSAVTIQKRQGTLLRFAKWLAPRSLLEATSGDVVGWFDELGFSARTRQDRAGDLHSFFNWALNEEIVDRDPAGPLLQQRRPVNAGDFPEFERGWWVSMERKALKPSTIKSRAQLLRLFYDWMCPKSIIDANANDIQLWLDSRKLGPKSRYTSISNLHMFYHWARREGLVAEDPTLDIDRPRLPQSVPRPIRDDHLAVALAQADTVTRAVLSLAAFCGMRAGEIAGLRREDILDHLDPPMLIVAVPKGHRQRTVPLHPEAWKAVQPILPIGGPVFAWTASPNGAAPGRRVNNRQWPAWKVSQVGNTHLASLQIPSSLHKLRSWYATNLHRISLDLRLTQELMGHSSPTTTALYVSWNQAAATEVVGKLRVG
jgi:integrase/recombinase XerC